MPDQEKTSGESIDWWKQYDRFILQLREEVRELYWLYNFFFVVSSALLGAFLIDKVPTDLKFSARFVGLGVSILWFLAFNKQKKWRDVWFHKITWIEENKLGIRQEDWRLRMWTPPPAVSTDPWIVRMLFRNEGLANMLKALPVVFYLVWWWQLGQHSGVPLGQCSGVLFGSALICAYIAIDRKYGKPRPETATSSK